jgi:hypothetical protein
VPLAIGAVFSNVNLRHDYRMRVAGFVEKPNAQAAARILREHGYEAELIGVAGETSPSRHADLPEPVLNARWANAFLLSNCDSEYFSTVVLDNFGTVLWDHRPGRFHRLETESPFGSRKRSR